MKILKCLLLAATLIGSLASCSKDDDASPVVGVWSGYWGFDFDDPSYSESWDLKKGGELVAYNVNGDKMAEGRWEVNGFNFEAHYTTINSDNTYKFSGLYSDTANEITGNWGSAPSTTNGGTFIMHKE